MGEHTAIAWCDHTFNPWIGCEKDSAGCANCYAEALMDTRYGRVKWGRDGTRLQTRPSYWREALKWDRQAPEKFAGRKPRVFCGSLCDVGEDRPDLIEPRKDLCNLIRRCENLQFLLLTKRPQNMNRLFPASVLERCWVGTSVAEQKDVDAKVPELLRVPALLRFVSAEPLVSRIYIRELRRGPFADDPRVDWLIIGGESGPRPFDVEWGRELIRDSKQNRVPVFMKQLGSVALCSEDDHFEYATDAAGLDRWRAVLKAKKGDDPAEWPEDLRVQEFPASPLAAKPAHQE